MEYEHAEDSCVNCKSKLSCAMCGKQLCFKVSARACENMGNYDFPDGRKCISCATAPTA